MAVSITPPDANRPILNDDGTMDAAFRGWVNAITRGAIIIGQGSPENVIDAVQGREYMDSNGASGAVKYIKKLPDISGDTKRGWVAI